MKNILLTSCGLETKVIEDAFLKMLPKSANEIKALFIPTAAVFPDAISVLPKCLNDLLKCGIKKENIDVYDLHKKKTAINYDVIYLCGGSPQYLMERINEIGFDSEIKSHIENEKIVVGVSAGSMVFANNVENSLGLLPYSLAVHCSPDVCDTPGIICNKSKDRILLGNKQAIIFTNDTIEIIE